MTVVTITLDDSTGVVAVDCTIPGGFDAKSPACSMANAIMNYLDARTAKAAPTLVHTAQEHNAKRAELVRHIAPEQIVIHAG